MKNRIKNWIQNVNEKQLSEWILIQVCLGKNSVKVFDRVKSDFNPKLTYINMTLNPHITSRVFHIKLVGDEEDKEDSKAKETQWTDLLVRIRECISTSCENCISDYENAIRTMDANRMTPGWNFHNFFLTKVFISLLFANFHKRKVLPSHMKN